MREFGRVRPVVVRAGVTLDDLVKRYADRADIRAYGFFLPPINDLPLFVLIGVGAVWY